MKRKDSIAKPPADRVNRLPTEADWRAILSNAAPDPVGLDQAAEDARWAGAATFTGNTTPAQARAVLRSRRVGERGPQKAPTKVQIGLRVRADTLDRFKATGKGWQTRMDDWLAQAPL